MVQYLRVLVAAALILAPASGILDNTAVKVVSLSVDGRNDDPLGLDNPRPVLAWQMKQAADCATAVCPADAQTGYQVQAAASVADLQTGKFIWDSGKVDGNAQQLVFGKDLHSRDTVAWRVKVWDAHQHSSHWSKPSTWTMGLLDMSDWGAARWIEYPGRLESQPLPLFARQFKIPTGKKATDARLYLAGVGMHHVTVNGEEVTDEVLAPGYSNFQLSVEYRTYDLKDVLRSGENAIGVALGLGTAYIHRAVTNLAVNRTSPYSWWESQFKGNGTLVARVPSGSTRVQLSSVTGYTLGGSINIDTGDGGQKLESRVITAINTNTISFSPGLDQTHKAGAIVTGSGNNLAASDPSAGAAVTPRLIGRLELTYDDGDTEVIVTNRDWHTSFGPLTTTQWYSGSDYDARREEAGWDGPGGNLTAAAGWVKAGFAPPPNLATKLNARRAEPVKIRETFHPVSVTNPANGTWVFDFGQNFAGLPQLNLPQMPAGVTIKMAPAESLTVNGTIEQSSLGPGSRGTDLFNTYTTAGRAGGETWRPMFNYFGMKWLEVTGLPDGFQPTTDLITGLRVQVNAPIASTFKTSDARINRIHNMAHYSFASNMISVFTDCPGREKNSYPADYIQPMGAISRNFHVAALLRTDMHHLVEGQSIANTSMAGNVALKTPVYDWGYTGNFGDEINWGNGIVLVPSLLHDLYGDTSIMEEYYDRMVFFVEYIQRQKVVDGYLVDGLLADWEEDSSYKTSGYITGTWGYYLTISAMARMANLTGHVDDAKAYTTLAGQIRDAFNAAFYDDAQGMYTNTGNNGTSNATQTAQALALDAGLVPEVNRMQVLDALVQLVNDYHPSAGGQGPHFSGATIGMGPIVRALSAGGRDDVLWEAVLQDDEPSYGYFIAPTVANPDGYTTVGEQWNRGGSKNHMILAQIEEWFHAGIVGIRPFALSTLSASWDNQLIIQPKLVGNMTSASGTYQTPQGEISSAWKIDGDRFRLTVNIPANTKAEVRIPAAGAVTVSSDRAKHVKNDGGYAIYNVPSGTYIFKSSLAA